MNNRFKYVINILLIFMLVLLANAPAYTQIPTPSQTLGFKPGADYKLADYEELLNYYDKLDAASDRVKKVQIGETVLGRPMVMLIISSKDNMQRLDHWKEISAKLALAKVDSAKADKFSREGKAVVWLDAGIHSTELGPGQMMPELAYRLTSEESSEMQKIRDNIITLLMPMMNPDGLDIVADWYRSHIGTPFETTDPPWLYHFYVGHDDNRDWFMNNMPETRAVTNILYRQWYPQIVYNHHQPAPAWTRISIPPYSDPVNQHIPPAVTAGVNAIGSAMAQRFALKGMPGAIADNGYTMFWDGGARTVPYYHNQIGILTETAHKTPTPRFYDPDSLPKTVGEGSLTDGTDIFYAYPWKGGESHLRDAVEYSETASMAALSLAADRRQNYLWNIYRMGRDAIQKGKEGDPFAYVIPGSGQWDNGEALNLVNVLYLGGIRVEKASGSFSAGNKQYAAGSYIIKAGQAFRPYVMDLLEKQDYPTLLQYPGGPPDPPYDLAGWTLPIQMGVTVDRINKPFNVKTNPVTDLASPEAGRVSGNAEFGYLLSAKENASYKAVNKLLGVDATIYRTEQKGGGAVPGSFVIEAGGNVSDSVKKIARREGLDFKGLSQKPDGPLQLLHRPRIGLYKSWVANIDEGWTRWLLKNQYAFRVDTLHDANVRGDDLSKFQAIIVPDQYPSRIVHGFDEGSMPAKYTGGMGLEGVLALKQFVQQGGTLLTFDSASDFAIEQFGLPVEDVVRGLSNQQFFIPGSLIRMNVDTTRALAYGMQPQVAASFSHSRAFEISRPSRHGEGGFEDIKAAPEPKVKVITRYAKEDLLMSGWAMGAKKYIADKPAMLDASYGEGHIILYGFRPQFRGQPHGTYKLIFNALYGADFNVR